MELWSSLAASQSEPLAPLRSSGEAAAADAQTVAPGQHDDEAGEFCACRTCTLTRQLWHTIIEHGSEPGGELTYLDREVVLTGLGACAGQVIAVMARQGRTNVVDARCDLTRELNRAYQDVMMRPDVPASTPVQ
jgi:hypothetical protein